MYKNNTETIQTHTCTRTMTNYQWVPSLGVSEHILERVLGIRRSFPVITHVYIVIFPCYGFESYPCSQCDVNSLKLFEASDRRYGRLPGRLIHRALSQPPAILSSTPQLARVPLYAHSPKLWRRPGRAITCWFACVYPSIAASGLGLLQSNRLTCATWFAYKT